MTQLNPAAGRRDYRLTFLLLHAQEKNNGTDDVDDGDDPGGNHVGRFLRGRKQEDKR